MQEFALVLILLVVEALARVRSLGEEAGLAGDRGAVSRAGRRCRRVGCDAVSLILQLFKFSEELVEKLLSLVFLLH